MRKKCHRPEENTWYVYVRIYVLSGLTFRIYKEILQSKNNEMIIMRATDLNGYFTNAHIHTYG